MEKNIVYGFLGGLFIGRFTNLFFCFIAAGVALYFYKPELYTPDNLQTLRETLIKTISNK